MEFRTTHNLPFECAQHVVHKVFRVGTCHGQWGNTKDSFYILSIINNQKGNGHLQDVFEWFEHSCKRESMNLLVLCCFNKNFYQHLIDKRGFTKLDDNREHAIKIFDVLKYQDLLKNGNSILKPKTFQCV